MSTHDSDQPSTTADLFTDAADTEYLRRYDIQMTPFLEELWRASQDYLRSEDGAE